SLDFGGLAARATRLLDDPAVRAAEQGRYAHMLVDDYEGVTVVAARLVDHMTGLGATLTVTGNPPSEIAGAPVFDVELTQRFRHPTPPWLVVCNHPAIEAEAVAGELLAARDEGLEWADMAVLLRSAGSRARAISRALARHGIPADAVPLGADEEPVVGAIVDLLRWVNGDAGALDRLLVSPVAGFEQEPGLDAQTAGLGDAGALVALRDDLAGMAPNATPADLVFEIWTRALGGLAAGGIESDTTLDAVVAFIAGLQRRAARRPTERLAEFLTVTGGRLPAVGPGHRHPTERQAVTVTTISAAEGREWRTVVIAGCVEGELPRVRERSELFDPSLLRAGAVPNPAERRHLALADERRLFESATHRATQRVVGIVAAAPGVLPSRFVESWPTGEPRLVAPPGHATGTLPLTDGPARAFPGGHLRLSASQLSLYEDCPLRYAYHYVLGARTEAGVHASLGTLVHAVLAEFLDPTNPDAGDLSRERLRSIAARHWRDDIAPYRPQVEEIRRDYFSMLEGWYDVEGGDAPLRPEVLDVEREFEIAVGPHTLTGYIDRVDRADGGRGVRVVDYKTGRRKPNVAEVADNIQLAVYHLGASVDPDLRALGPPTQLRLLYLRDMRVFEQEVVADHAAMTETRVLATAERILDEDYAPSVDADCRTCPYHRLCPLHDEGRQVAR
nr:PD-(D/E)XK nuclease family protein [Actinomycetota bacterium]